MTDALSTQARNIKLLIRNAKGQTVKVVGAGDKANSTWHGVKWKPRSKGTYSYVVMAQDSAGNEQTKAGGGKVKVKSHPLEGSAAYVMHLSSMPPVKEAWSVTVYTLAGTLIPNPEKRYQFNNRSRLTRNPDGSVDIYLQATAPAEAPAQKANWLPVAPGQGFEVIWRLMGTRPSGSRASWTAAAGSRRRSLRRTDQPVRGRAGMSSPCHSGGGSRLYWRGPPGAAEEAAGDRGGSDGWFCGAGARQSGRTGHQ